MEGYWKKVGKFVVQTQQQRLPKEDKALKHDKHAAKKPIITHETRFTLTLFANHIQTKRQSPKILLITLCFTSWDPKGS